MANVIQLLETLATQTRQPDDMELRTAAAGMPAAVADALRARDAAALAAAMRLSPTLACYITAPEQDAPAREDEDVPADDTDEPDSSDKQAA